MTKLDEDFDIMDERDRKWHIVLSHVSTSYREEGKSAVIIWKCVLNFMHIRGYQF